METITLCMLGPEAVGKTTLLATMYKEFNKILTKFDFNAKNDTGIDLDEAFHKLESVVDQPVFTTVTRLLPGTQGILKREFEILFNGSKEIELHFYDHAGGLTTTREKSGDPDFENFKKILKEASVIINVVDGAALMEGNIPLYDRINKPTRISDLLTEPFNHKKERLLLFVITKCEKWLKNTDAENRLLDTFKERHKEVINLVLQRNNVVAAVIPVKTIGCVEFSRIEDSDGEMRFIFLRKPNLPFAPERVDQPLRYALTFALAKSNSHRPFWEWLLRKLNKKEKLFAQALREFARERKSFQIFGNQALLEVA